MSSLRNQIIKLAYLNPDLRGDLLPLIIKKNAYASGTFEQPAKELYDEVGLQSNMKSKEEKDKQEIQAKIKDAFDKAIKSIKQENLKPPTFDSKNIKPTPTGTVDKVIYKDEKDNFFEGMSEAGQEEFKYKAPTGFKGTFVIRLNLKPFDQEIEKLFLRNKLEKTPDGKEIEVPAQSNPSEAEVLKTYTAILNDTEDSWKDDVNGTLLDRLKDQQKKLKEEITPKLNEMFSGLLSSLPPVAGGKVRPSVEINGDLDMSVMQGHEFTQTGADAGTISFTISFGGSCNPGVVITESTATQTQSTPMDLSSQTEQVDGFLSNGQ